MMCELGLRIEPTALISRNARAPAVFICFAYAFRSGTVISTMAMHTNNDALSNNDRVGDDGSAAAGVGAQRKVPKPGAKVLRGQRGSATLE